MAHYSLREALALGSPLQLAPDEAICDAHSCCEMAIFLVPKAAVCAEHAEAYGVGGDRDRYEIPLGELVGGLDWRQARLDLYLEKCGQLPPLERDERRDQLLEELTR
jgi:hypothetical protein